MYTPLQHHITHMSLVDVVLVVVNLVDEAALETAGLDEPAFLGDDLTPGVLTLSCH